MIDQDRSSKETMLRNSEASAGCLRTNIPYNLHGGVNVIQELSKVMDAPNIHSGRSLVESGNSSVRQGFMPQNEGYNSPFNSQEFHMFSPYYSEFQKSSQNQWSVSGNIVYPLAGEYFFPIDNIVPYMPFQMISPTYMQGFPSQEFTYFVVIDFEATCDKDRNLHPQEIIEFPSVLVNSLTGKLEASFQTYVRPAYHQHLTDFCKELTGIQQIQVDRGVPLGDALLSHDKWLEAKGIKHTKFAVVTWGDWDCRVMLESECKFKSIRKPPYFNSWINLKILFQEVFGGVRCNLKEAVQMAGLIWEGRPHCGLDDALNTARLLSLLMSRGIRFSITNSLTQQSNDRPIPCVPCTNGTLAIPASQHEKSNLQQQQQLVGLTNAFKIHQRQLDPTSKEARTYCFCGAMTSKRMIRKPGPKQGMFFFGCGNWTTARGAMCNYFEWAS